MSNVKQYNIVVIGSDYLVDGEVARWDDYNYADKDWQRQFALAVVEKYLKYGHGFKDYPWEMFETPLHEVVGQLKLTEWNKGEVVPMSEIDSLKASHELLTTIVDLEESEQGDYL